MKIQKTLKKQNDHMDILLETFKVSHNQEEFLMKSKMKLNTILYATNADNKNGFNIYISQSGQIDYLMFHRHNACLYNLLKDGIALDEFERKSQQKRSEYVTNAHKGTYRHSGLKCKKNYSRKLDNTFQHIIKVVNDYLCYEKMLAA